MRHIAHERRTDRTRTLLACLLVAVIASRAQGNPTVTQPEPAAVDAGLLARAQVLAQDERVARSLALLRGRETDILALQIRIAETPTDDWRATRRATLFETALREAGLADVHRDSTGNVLGRLPGRSPGMPVIVLSGHLDTVFPELTAIRVERQGTLLRAPGIGDDAAGLAAVVHLVRALRDARVPLRRDLVVAGTVGEEGEGDLRGVKALFRGELRPENVAAFMTLDLGTQTQIVNEGLGSRRLKIEVRGPGGHSWGDFGRPNPIHALARALDLFLETPMPSGVRSSFNVGTIEGGTGVNVIPESASMRVDLRSESTLQLDQLEANLRTALEAGLASERDWSRDGSPLMLDVETIGERPIGRTPPESLVVRATVAAFAAQSLSVVLASSSTDANLPMSLGVPSLALPHGCQGQDAHSRAETCDIQRRPQVLAAELVATVLLAELDGPVQPRRQPTD